MNNKLFLVDAEVPLLIQNILCRFYDAILAKERRRSLRFRHHLSYDVERSEFLCPLCETLSNTVIPLIPQISTLLRNKYELPWLHRFIYCQINDKCSNNTV